MCYQAFNSFHLELQTLAPTLIKQFKIAKYSESKKNLLFFDLKKRTCPFFFFVKERKGKKMVQI